jgi:hypothetical protein
MEGMGIGQRTRCFDEFWSNSLLRLKESVEKEQASDFTVDGDERQDATPRKTRNEQ